MSPYRVADPPVEQPSRIGRNRSRKFWFRIWIRFLGWYYGPIVRHVNLRNGLSFTLRIAEWTFPEPVILLPPRDAYWRLRYVKKDPYWLRRYYKTKKKWYEVKRQWKKMNS